MADPRVHRYANNASCRLGEDLTAGETSIQLETGKGVLFPNPGVGEIFILTIEHLITGVKEIMFCTSRSGDVLEVERGQEGTDAVEWTNDNNVIVQQRLTAGTLEHLEEGGSIDFDISDPQPGDVLMWDGYAWVNRSGVEINERTDSYTLQISDCGRCVEMNAASANNLTIPPNSDVPIPVDSVILVRQMGVGVTSILAGSGVTIRTPSTLSLRARYSLVSLHKRGTNEWCIEGGLG